MATTLDQQVALDEALVPSAQRLRIGRSNFRLPSDIQSKEPTLQVVYDVLRNSPFFKAFLVTADVPKIYMQEFWATTKLHQHSVCFKMDTRKHVLDLEAFREMLHISPRMPSYTSPIINGEDSLVIVTCGRELVQRTSANMRKHPLEAFRPSWCLSDLIQLASHLPTLHPVHWSVLTQKGLEVFCESFHIPDVVHPQLPSPNQTIHEMPTEKIEMDLFSFIQVADPTKVKVGELERDEVETRLLDSTMGRAVLLLPVAPTRVDSELEASVERLFAEGIVFGDDLAAEKPKRLRKKRQATTDAGGSSHPPKKLRSDYGTSSVAVSVGKSPSALKDLLASSVLNVESGIEVVASLHFVTSSVSATPERDSGVLTASVTGPSLHPIGAPERFVIFSYSSHHSTKDSDSTGTVRPDAAGSSHAPGKELSMGSREVNSKSLHEVFVSRWNIPNDALLDSLDA
nr:hypothetical protein [Tanacetum cinerariifolium]